MQKIENVIEKYLNWKEIENFMRLKKSAIWLCLVKDDFNKICLVHRFLIGAENKIIEVPWEEKINVFLDFAKKMKIVLFLFMIFIHFLTISSQKITTKMRTIKELTFDEERQLYIHLQNYIVFEEDEEICKFFDEYERTFINK